MANEERIDSIVSSKAYKQLDDLSAKLTITQKNLVDNIEAAIKLNGVLGNSKSIKDLEVNNQKAAQAVANLNKVQAQTILIETRIEEKRNQISAKEEVRINKQIALENKKRQTIVSNSQAEIEASIQSAKGNEAVTSTLNETNLSRGRSANAFSAQTTAQVTNTQATQKSNLTKKQQAFLLAEEKANLIRNTAALKNQVRELNSAKGSLEQRRAALIRLTLAYDNLSAAERKSSQGVRLQGVVTGLTSQVKELEAATGRAQRNVGNYSSALTRGASKAFSILRQAAYILPGLGIAGIIGIITDPIINLISKLEIFKTKIGQFASNLSSLNDVQKTASKDYGEQTTKLNVLYKSATNVNIAIEDRIKFGRQLQKDFPEAFKNSKIQSLLNGEESEAYRQLSKDILQNAKARAAASKIQELSGNLQDIDFQKEKIRIANSNEKINGANELTKKAILLNKTYTNAQEKFKITQTQLNREIEGNVNKPSDLRAKQATSLQNQNAKIIKGQIDFLVKYAGGEEELAKTLLDPEKTTTTGTDTRKSVLEQKLKDVKLTADSILSSELSTFNERIQAVKSFEDKSNQLIINAKNEKVLTALESSNKLKEIDLEASKDRLKIRKDAQKAELDALESQFNSQIEAAKKADKVLLDQLALASEQRQSLLSESSQSELLILAQQFSEGKLTAEEYAQKRVEIQRKLTADLINEDIRAVQLLIDLQKAAGIDTLDNEKKLAEFKQKLSKETVDNQIEDLERLQERERQIIGKRKEIAQELGNFAIAIVQGQFRQSEDLLIKEGEQIDIKKARDIDSVQRSIASEQEKADRISIINAQAENKKEILERKQRQLDIERAKFDKLAGIAQIKVSTASAVAQALPNIPLSILIAALGATQLATAIATRLPRFEDGGVMDKTGLAEFGHGTELRIDPDGKMSLTNSTPEVGMVQKGTEFISNKDLMKILSSPDQLSYAGAGSIDMKDVISATKQSEKSIVNAILSTKQRSGKGVSYYSTSKGQSYRNRNIN